jgi:hypothetical protein
MTLIDGFRRLLFSLRRHLGWIWRAGNAAWAELLALNVVLREVGLDAIWLAFPAHANLPDFPSKRRLESVVPSSRSSDEVRALRYIFEADGDELAEIAVSAEGSPEALAAVEAGHSVGKAVLEVA